MKNIIIGFSKPKNHPFPIFSWLIRLYEKTAYSHVYIRWQTDLTDQNLCYQASGSSVHFLGSKKFNESIDVIEEYSIEISDAKYKDMVRFCIDNAGYEYGLMQAIGIFIVDLFSLQTNPWKKGYICSELVASMLQSQLLVTIDKDLQLITPKDINVVCKKYGKRL